MGEFFKWLGVGAVAFAGLLAGSAALAPNLIQTGVTLEQIKAATFMLSENGVAICTGQFIDEDTFLTAAHCIREEAPYPLYYAVVIDNVKVPMTVISDNNGTDVAILEVTGEETFPYVPVAVSFEGYMGQELLNAHFPMVLGHFFFSDALLVDERPAPQGLANEGDVYAVTVPNMPGSSGSGLYVEVAPGQYQLIGILSGGFGLAFNFFVTLEGILAAIDGQ